MSVAGEIPATIVAYVALLMFVQAGTPVTWATLYCGYLFLPWTLKDHIRNGVARLGRLHIQIRLAELATALALVVLSAVFSVRGRIDGWLLATLLPLSALATWHEAAADLYYETALPAMRQRLWSGMRMFFSQAAAVFTYGLVLMFVGALQVVHRSIRLGWSHGLYGTAGVFLLFAIFHILFLPWYGTTPACTKSGQTGVRTESGARPWLAGLLLLLLLLPQSLMFLSRTVFLITPASEGGLGRTIQDVAFAQGAVGVLAYTIGTVFGRRMMTYGAGGRHFWPMVVSLGLSPSIYVIMTATPPQSLAMLCVATFSAQFLFGFGIPVCQSLTPCVCGESHCAAVSHIRTPAVAAAMLLPVCLSGWLVSRLGFGLFFAVDALIAPLAWLVLYVCKRTMEREAT